MQDTICKKDKDQRNIQESSENLNLRPQNQAEERGADNQTNVKI